MSFAKVTVAGLVESEPEKRFTANDHAITQFTLSVENSRQGQDETLNGPFPVQVVCWRALAESAGSQIHKGDYVVVDGKLMINASQSPEGVQKKTYEIEAANIDKLPGAPESLSTVGQTNAGGGSQQASSRPSAGGSSGASSSYGGTPQQQSAPSFNNSEELLTEDDIPF